MDAYRTPDERFDGLPGYAFEPHYVEQDGLRLHYVDEGSGPPVLLLHGEPTWSYLYRKVVPQLTATTRAIAPDYFGFGRSDKPLRLQDYTYDFPPPRSSGSSRSSTCTTQRSSSRTGAARSGSRRGRAPRPRRPARDHEHRHRRPPPSEEWLRFRDWVRRLGTELIPGRLIRISAVQPLSDEVEEAYSAPWPVPESKAGVLAFPELVPISPDHPDTPAHLAVREQLGRWEQPALVLFSDSDPIFSPRVADRIAAHIPGALEPEIVAGAGPLPPGGSGRGDRPADRALRRS